MVTRKDLAAEVSELLAEDGFRKRAGLIWTAELAEDVLGLVGLNLATKYTEKGEVQVNPVIGLRHQEIERTVAQLCDEKFHPYQPSTISTPLGYLLPERAYRTWLFPIENFTATAEEMVEHIRGYGMPFWRRHITLAEITQQLKTGFGPSRPDGYRLPVAYVLTGNEDRAMETLRAELDLLGDRDDPAATRYRRFAERFRSQLTLRA